MREAQGSWRFFKQRRALLRRCAPTLKNVLGRCRGIEGLGALTASGTGRPVNFFAGAPHLRRWRDSVQCQFISGAS